MYSAKGEKDDKNIQTFKMEVYKYQLTIKIRKQTIYFDAVNLRQCYTLKGQFTFDALPQTMRAYQNMKNVYQYIKLEQNHKNIDIRYNSLNITFYMAGLIKKQVSLALQKYEFTQNQRKEQNLRNEIEEMKDQLQKMQKQKYYEQRQKQKYKKLYEEKCHEWKQRVCLFWVVVIIIFLGVGGHLMNQQNMFHGVDQNI